jgi:hypothetical protein
MFVPVRPARCTATVIGLSRELRFVRAVHLIRSALLLAVIFLIGVAPPLAIRAGQDTPQTASQEMVVNLAAGRVLVAVTKDAILIGTVEDAIEQDTHPPIPAQIGSSQVGVILGAVEWIAPASKRQMARLDQELPRLRGREAPVAPHLASKVGMEATDLEAVGDGLLSRLNELAGNLHGKLNLPPGEPLAILIVADYVPGYGPEVWRLDYRLEQAEESPGYWTTRVLRPSYVQFWPPEKDQPHTLLEFAYPPGPTRDSGGAGSAPASLVELWRNKDPRLEQIASSDPALGDAARGVLQGESDKVAPPNATQFLRAAMDATSPRGARQTFAALGEESGFRWILPPPVETVRPGLRPERPPGAPSLVKPQQ